MSQQSSIDLSFSCQQTNQEIQPQTDSPMQIVMGFQQEGRM